MTVSLKPNFLRSTEIDDPYLRLLSEATNLWPDSFMISADSCIKIYFKSFLTDQLIKWKLYESYIKEFLE